MNDEVFFFCHFQNLINVLIIVPTEVFVLSLQFASQALSNC